MQQGDGNRLFDCVVIGGGPAGLSASLMLARYRRAAVTLHNNQNRNAASREIHGFLGHDGIDPKELLRRGRAEVRKYGGLVIEASVERVTRDCAEFVIEAGTSYRARTVLLATGVRDIYPDVSGFSDFYGTSIHHCPDCDGYEVTNKEVAVLGSGDKAAGLLKALRVWTSQLTLLTSGEADPPSPADIPAEVRVIQSRIAAIEGNREARQVERVRFADGKSMACDAIFFDSGTVAAGTLHQNLGCRLDDETGLIWVDDDQQTSVPGVYAAGDVTPLSRMAVMAAAEGAMAAIHIHKALLEAR